MKKKKNLLILTLAFVLLLGAASVLYPLLGERAAPDTLAVQNEVEDIPEPSVPAVSAPSSPTPSPPPATAPDFTVYDREGSPVRLSDHFGKPIVLNFWASWCGPCQMEMPHFQSKYLELGDEVTFLMVNVTSGRETASQAASFIEKHGYTFPVFYDTDSYASVVYGAAYSLPVTYFINAAGEPVARASGSIDAETLQRGIDMIR